jgi:hypothetical protein
MPHFRIHMINSEVESSEGDYQSLDEARRAAIATAARVASEAIAEGQETASVELRIEDGDKVIARHVVNLSVAPLLPDE